MTPSSVWPSALVDDVSTPVVLISQLNALPACAPVDASHPASRLTAHDSGSGRLARPFLCDSLIHDSTPVYPGAPTIHFVPLPRLVFPTPEPLFSPERNCRPETIRSTSIAAAH